MYCQRCKKQAATVHVTDILHGESMERHLCEQCAVEEKAAPPPVMPFTSALADFIQKTPNAAGELARLTCPHCNMTFVEFRNTGLLGCPSDYDAFERALVPLIEKAHEGAGHHIGKIPRRLGAARPPEDDLIRLRDELARAVTSELYEKAASLRDQIRTLETQ